MKGIIILTIISGITFLIFLTTLIWGFAKKSMSLKMTALLMFFVFAGLSGFTVFDFLSKSINKATTILKPRTGDEIYDALFGHRQSDCIKVLNHQDQVIPKIDFAIWLQFEACPSELNRMLSLKEFTSEIVSENAINAGGKLSNPDWFQPETLGDSIMIFIYNKDQYGNGQYIYSSADSTMIFVKDILD